MGATIVVVLAIALMIGLGIWQLQRRAEKEAALVQLAANVNRRPIALPDPPSGDVNLFRRTRVECARVLGWSSQSGRSAAGVTGWRQIAACATPGGRTVSVQFGVARDPKLVPQATALAVTGYLTYAPTGRSLVEDVFRPAPKPLMLVADRSLPGLEPNPGPDLSAVPNNHLAYAVQWFLFAGIAGVIYAVALRRRETGDRDRSRP